MARTNDGQNESTSSLTEVWIGLGFFAIVVTGVVTVFGEQLVGAFSTTAPAQENASKTRATTTTSQPSAAKSTPSATAPAK